MALNIDPSRPPTLHNELERLVHAVIAATPADENDAVEWKSNLDCASKHGHSHIARAIIAFANRIPDVAERTFQGHAYLLVGVEPGNLAGVVQVDVVDLEQGVVRYVGEDGPRWRPTWVSVSGKHVLVVDVDRPRWGDPIHAIRKGGENVSDGQVFVRGKASSRPATSADLRALQDRLTRGTETQALDITVSLASPSELTPLNYSSDDWIAKERARLLAPLHQDRRLDGLGGSLKTLDTLARMGAFAQETPESRTEAEYLDAVEGYLHVCEARFPRALDLAASRSVDPLVLAVTNNTARNLPGLELILHVPGFVRGISPDASALEDVDAFPRAPRLWGPRKSPLASFDSGLFPTSLAMRSFAPRHFTPKPRIDNGGSVTITFLPEDIRPHYSVELDPTVLLISEPLGTVVTATWTATSTGVDGTAAGQLELPVASVAASLQDLLEEPE